MKDEFIMLITAFIKEKNDEKRNKLQTELINLVKKLKMTFNNDEAEMMSKNHLIHDINEYAISPNESTRSMLIIQLNILPTIIY
jgi:hypothetical protein